jgi:AcrR family transcriptional regulator
VVIINQRQIQKNETRNHILHQSKRLIFLQGVKEVSTKELAKYCSVSQGSLFLHFGTKENLIAEVFETELFNLETNLKEISKKDDLLETAEQVLEVMIKYEDVLARLYFDYFYISDDIKSSIQGLETSIKNILFDCMRKQNKTIQIVDTFMLLDAWYAQVKVFLNEKTTFSDSNSVLRKRRGKILKLFRFLFTS